MIEIKNLKIPLNAGEDEIKRIIAKKLRIKVEKISSFNVAKRSVDARKKDDICFVMSVDINLLCDEKSLVKKLHDSNICEKTQNDSRKIHTVKLNAKCRPVICGSGPAGLFAALYLSECGAKPIVIEQGADVDSRLEAIQKFKTTGILDTESNIQFGEGGAGTFSDGKLTTNTHDERCSEVLKIFVENEAPEEILWQAKPHIGTDKLPNVIKNIRHRILEYGGEILFKTKLTDITVENNKIKSVTVTNKGTAQEIPTDKLVLATGHSARDIFELLYRKGVNLTQKAFSIGVRIEHPRELIDASQYGKFAGNKALGAADYKLWCHLPSGRSVYTFCMCPGGEVVAAASEKDTVVTNGMSRFARNGINSNSAFLTNVETSDFGSSHPLAGVEFQRKWERTAFECGGRNYSAPAQLVGDFIKGQASTGIGNVKPTYPLGVKMGDISACLPEFVSASLKDALPIFDSKLKGFAMPDAIMTGVETRSSSPVRIVRDEKNYQSNIQGLFPCGEGAGYAGGIVSAAVDGLRIAQYIAEIME